MSKKTTSRVLCLLLAFVMVLGMVPMAAAASHDVKLTQTSPNTNKLSAAIQQNKIKQLNGEAAYADSDTVRAIVIFDGEAAVPAMLKSRNGIATQSRVAAKARSIASQHARVKTAIEQEAVNYDVKYEYTTLLNGMSVDVKFGDLEKLANTAGVKKVYLANHYDAPIVEKPSMDSSNKMTRTALLHKWNSGKGTVVAIIDTGITPGHEAFKVYDNMMDEAVLTEETVENASTLGAGQYLSAKIPFAYDYFDQDNDATDDVSGHGTHVAGIAAGYVQTEEGDITFSGSAPGAQILAMKVFSSNPKQQSTNSDVYYAALEDAYTLGADVVNMSLGAQNGFVYNGNDIVSVGDDEEEVLMSDVFDTLDKAGIICSVAAGNEGSMADNASNGLGAGYVTSDYADYGVVGSPSTYDGNLSVASIDNAKYATAALEVDGQKIGYSDTVDAYSKLKGKTFDFVVIPDTGTEADFTAVGEDAVKGKVAVIKRGGISFVDKVNNAQKAGAAAAIIYNNVSGVINMALDGTTLPAVSVSGEDASKLLDAATKQVTFLDGLTVVDNPTGWQVSSFSSWGCTPSLTLKPQISGVGGSILSAENNSENKYQVMSGTSMATPDITGISATLLSFLREKRPYKNQSKQQQAALTEALLLSSAQILRDEYGDMYSPRRQGAGLADTYGATQLIEVAKAYITDPIDNIGDDPAKTGHFTVTYHVQDTRDPDVWEEDEDGYYNEIGISYSFMCDTLVPDTQGNLLPYNGLWSAALAGDEVDVKTTAGGEEIGSTLKLAPGETKEVTVEIQLKDETMAYLNEDFPNGTFVEGYVNFSGKFDTKFHGTFMGFYGDWTQAPVMEQYDWRDYLTGNDDMQVNTSYNDAGLITAAGIGYYAGANAYDAADELTFGDARVAVSSPDSAAVLRPILYMAPMTLRNARHLIMVISDHETGEVYFVDDTEYMPKAYFDTDYNVWRNTGSFLWIGTDLDDNAVPNNTKVDISYYANIPYGEDTLGALTNGGTDYSTLKTQGAKYLEWNFPCTVDSEAPKALTAQYDPDTGVLTVEVQDNQYLAYAAVYGSGSDAIDDGVYAEDEAGKKQTLTFELGDTTGVVELDMVDYATNVSAYLIDLGNASGGTLTNCTVTLQSYDADKGLVKEATSANWAAKDVFEVWSGDEVTALARPAEGEKFYAWMEDGKIVSTSAEYTFTAYSDTTLTAVFDPIYTVSFDSNGGSPVESQLVISGETAAAPADPTRGGLYTFAGWYLNGTRYDFSKPVTSDLKLTARWTLINEVIDPILPGLVTAGTTPVSSRFPFTDVSTSDWFYDSVKGAWENGLINGVTSTLYQPKGTLTVAEAIKLASALHQMIKDGKVTLTNGRGYWYETYVNYGVREGILDESYQKLSYEQMNKPVSRSEFVHIFFKALDNYKAINSVADNSIPDVKTADTYGDEIYTFYRAGILTGSDAAGTFHPTSTIVRSEVAAILVRMYDASTRVSITLK